MQRKSIAVILVSAFLAVFCHCTWMLPSHACCQPKVSIHSAQHPSDTQTQACCQSKATAASVSAATPQPIATDDWVAPSVFYQPTLLTFSHPQLQSAESRQFIKDQSKRRCLEFCVLLN